MGSSQEKSNFDDIIKLDNILIDDKSHENISISDISHKL